VQYLADRIGVISHGHLIEEATPESLGGRDVRGAVISFRLPPALSGVELPTGPWDEPDHHDGEIIMRTDLPTQALLELTRWAVGLGTELDGLSVIRPSLEDAYLQLTSEATAGDSHGR
jgi:ABC-2 type transport system ATP-binding protein